LDSILLIRNPDYASGIGYREERSVREDKWKNDRVKSESAENMGRSFMHA